MVTFTCVVMYCMCMCSSDETRLANAFHQLHVEVCRLCVYSENECTVVRKRAEGCQPGYEEGEA